MTLRHIHDTPRPASGLALAHDGLQLKAIDPNGRVYRVRPERGTPVHAVAASAALDPSEADNTVTLTSQSVGLEGNSLRAAMTVPTAASISVSKTGDVVSIAAGGKYRMVVTGTLTSNGATPVVFDDLVFHSNATIGGVEYPQFGDAVGFTDYCIPTQSDGVWNGWRLAKGVAAWTSPDLVDFPELCTTWEPVDTETGTPTVTASAPTAAQVVAAVNSAGLDVTASGTGTGTVAAVTTTAFTGGRYATLGSAGDQLFDDTNRYLASTDIHATSTTGWKTTAI